jgi:hypothetical protein
MVAGSGATEAETAAVPIRVPAAKGTPKTVLIPDANAGSKLKTIEPAEDERSKRATLPKLVPAAVTVPSKVLFVRSMLRFVSEAIVELRVRFSPPECVMLVVVSPPVIGNIAATGDVPSVAGVTGATLNPAPVNTDNVEGSNVTVVVPPVIVAACRAKGVKTATAQATAFNELW